MTRDEAERRCAELNDAAEEGASGRWMVQEGEGGDWHAVQVQLPGLTGNRRPLKESTEARPRPEADDPRDAVTRNLGGPYGPV
jgi:hypothetical protein